MAEETEKKAPDAADSDADALETSEDQVDALETSENPGENGVVDATSASGSAAAKDEAAPKKSLKQKLRKFNIYLLLFLFILMVAGVIIAIAYFQSKKASTTSTIKTQKLTQSTLQQVANSDATVGNSQSVLNVESSAVFAGKVLIRDGLEVAGGLHIGGTVTLGDIAVTGTSSLGQVDISKDLSVSGNSAIQGGLTIAKSLQVTGGATFGGPISAPQVATSDLQVNADLKLSHHITTSGGTPGSASGASLGSGGSATVSGSDTAGTATINTGSSPAAGCFITINFTSKYASTPRVLVTPVGSGAGALDFYVNRSNTSFSICDATPAPGGTSFAFDYFVIN
jgi:hypothetical protein